MIPANCHVSRCCGRNAQEGSQRENIEWTELPHERAAWRNDACPALQVAWFVDRHAQAQGCTEGRNAGRGKAQGRLLQGDKRCGRRYGHISDLFYACCGTCYPNCGSSQCGGSQCIGDLRTRSCGLPRLSTLDAGHGETHLVREWRAVAVA